MSYILDALRRADSERARGAVPGLHTPSVAHAGAGASDRPPARWAGPAAAVAGLAIAGLAGGWLWMREAPSAAPGVVLATGAASEPAQVPASTVPGALPVAPSAVIAAPQPSFAPTPTAVAAPPPVVRVMPAPARPPAASERPGASPGTAQATASAGMAGTTGMAGTSGPSASSAASGTRAASAPAAPRVDASASASAATVPALAAAAPAAAIAPAPTAAPRVYALGELPPDVRQRMPVLAVSGATYSANPTYRMVIVNGQVLHEGDTAGPGVALERIDQKSVVLAFQGYRVRVGY